MSRKTRAFFRQRINELKQEIQMLEDLISFLPKERTIPNYSVERKSTPKTLADSEVSTKIEPTPDLESKPALNRKKTGFHLRACFVCREEFLQSFRGQNKCLPCRGKDFDIPKPSKNDPPCISRKMTAAERKKFGIKK